MAKSPVSFWLGVPQAPAEAKEEILDLLRRLEELLPLDPVFEPIGLMIDPEGDLSIGMGTRKRPLLRVVRDDTQII